MAGDGEGGAISTLTHLSITRLPLSNNAIFIVKSLFVLKQIFVHKSIRTEQYMLHHFMKSAKMMSVMKAASSRRAEKALKEILDKAGDIVLICFNHISSIY